MLFLAVALPVYSQLPPNTLPAGGVVAAGAAVISSAGAAMRVDQASQKAVIDWQSFNIGRDASVVFHQPSATSIVLNRVGADGGRSLIDGRLSANGQVWLLNPGGMLFGPSARVDVGGLLASSLKLGNGDFLAGNYRFTRDGVGSVVNQGSLTAADGGYIALMAPEVRNEGVIAARLGAVALASGDELRLDLSGDRLIELRVDQAAVQGLVDNRNLVMADGGWVLLSTDAASRLSSGTVNNSGIVRATTLDSQGGVIRLLGGRVQVGGTLDASAPAGGDGGFIETSGARVDLAQPHRVTTLAPAGRAGTWLIDPNDFTVAAVGGDITGTQLGLDLGGGNVSIFSGLGATAGNGDIFVNDPVSWSANLLKLGAERNIALNANLNGSGSARLALEYGQGSVAAGNAASYSLAPGVKVNLPAGLNFSTRLGSDGATVPYQVITDLGSAGSTTGSDLQGINGNLAGNYVLGADIDASATAGWDGGLGFAPLAPCIGMACGGMFTGSLNGLGHVISGLTINRPGMSEVGFFGTVDSGSRVENLGLNGVNIVGYDDVGGLVGASGGAVTRSYATGVVRGHDYVGGLVGFYFDLSTISNSYASVTVSGNTDVGGLVGQNSRGTISNSYATGTVNGAAAVGGLVGSNGLGGAISNSYATGVVTGSQHVGGLAGYEWGGAAVTNSFWDTTTTGQAASAGGTGMTTAGMQAQANFTSATAANGGVNPNWDFGATWVMHDGHTYPLLRVFMTPLTVSADPVSKTYDGLAYGGGLVNAVYSIPGAPASVHLSGLATPYAGDVNAGSYAPGLWSDQQGYLITYAGGSLSIGKAHLTATADNQSRLFGQANPLFSQTLSGFVNGENAASAGVSGSATGSSTATVLTGVGTAPISGSTGTLAAANYDFTAADGVLTIGKAPLTVTANGASKTYDGLAYSGGNGVVYSGLVNGETGAVLGGALAYGGNAQGAIQPGRYAITPAGLTSANYHIDYIDGTLTLSAVDGPPNLAGVLFPPVPPFPPTVPPPVSTNIDNGPSMNNFPPRNAQSSAPMDSSFGLPTAQPELIVDVNKALPTAAGVLSRDDLQDLARQVHDARTQLFSDALGRLEREPETADIPVCGGGGNTECIASALVKGAGEANYAPVVRRRIALLIGNNAYNAPIPPLDTPINDVQAVGEELRTRLGYEVKVLRNAGRQEIIAALNGLILGTERDDSVLVMYAGHGYMQEGTKAGYWIPTDATVASPDRWISNTSIIRALGHIPAKQVMLVSDSCYSGTLAKEGKVIDAVGIGRERALTRRSVLAMSSGGEEPVSDEGRDDHSIFAWNLIQALRLLKEEESGQQMHARIREAVMREYPQEPHYGIVTSAGHAEGGEYLLTPRK